MSEVKVVLENAGIENTHWGLIILHAEERFSFNQEERKQSKSWITCACGKQSDLVPRRSWGEPENIRLANLGKDFCNYVFENDFLAAAVTLVEIERQAMLIIEKELKNKGK